MAEAPAVAQAFRAALNELYGPRLERVVLFGSQARGDAGPDSDYDVAVFLSGAAEAFDRWAELRKLAALRVRLGLISHPYQRAGRRRRGKARSAGEWNGRRYKSTRPADRSTEARPTS